jgi:hypothetical protein
MGKGRFLGAPKNDEFLFRVSSLGHLSRECFLEFFNHGKVGF